MARAMARELGPHNIRGNSITPGLTLTDFSQGANPDERKHEAAKSYPLGRVGLPPEIAGVILFLASELSSYVTGTTINASSSAYIA
jgi:NAD(P)-dependent dehydrogenase (short-subunit alcohol dehydrogenase family)